MGVPTLHDFALAKLLHCKRTPAFALRTSNARFYLLHLEEVRQCERTEIEMCIKWKKSGTAVPLFNLKMFCQRGHERNVFTLFLQITHAQFGHACYVSVCLLVWLHGGE